MAIFKKSAINKYEIENWPLFLKMKLWFGPPFGPPQNWVWFHNDYILKAKRENSEIFDKKIR